MPYVYPQIRAPFAGSLADTMLRQGDIAANAASQIGSIQAGAAARQGQIWGNAVNNIGQDVSNTVRYETDPRVQEEREQLAQRHAMVQGQAAVNHIVSTLTTQNADGSRTLDRAKLSQQMAAQNIPLSVQQQTFKALDDVDASIKTFNTARVDHMADLAHGILSAPGGATPQNVLTAAALAKANGLATDDQLTPIIGAATSGKDLTPMLTQMRSMSEKYKDLAKPTFAPRQSPGYFQNGQFTPIEQPEQPFTLPEGAIRFDASGNPVAYGADKPTTAKSLQRASVLLDGKPTEVFTDPDPAAKQRVFDLNGAPIQNAATRIKPIPPASVTIHNETQRSLSQADNPVVKGIAEYRIAPPSPRSMATPDGQALMAAVANLNPSYDATQFPNRQRTRIAFTTGTQGQQINAMNTAIGHLEQVADVAGDLGNSDLQIANRAKNWFATQFGGASVTNFDTAKTVLAGELASVFKRSGATDAEIKSVESTINSANSPAQLKGYADQVIPLLGSKLSALNYQYHQAMGEGDPFQALSPDAKQILTKRGFDPDHPSLKNSANAAATGDRMRVVGPNGETGTVPAGTTLPPGWKKQQ